MGTSDNSTRRPENNSLWGQNGAMRVHPQFLGDLSWQALSLWRLSEERHKLGDRPKVGEEHLSPLSANRRPVITHWKPRGQGGRKKTDHRWPFVDQLIYYLRVKGQIRPDHLRASAVTLDEPMMNCDRRRTHATVVVLSQNRATNRSTNRSSDEETKGPQPTSESSDKKRTSETGREKDTPSQMGLTETPRVVAGDCWLVLEEVEP